MRRCSRDSTNPTNYDLTITTNYDCVNTSLNAAKSNLQHGWSQKKAGLRVLNTLFLFQDRIPFAVVGSNTVVEVGGKKLRARVYPWGVAEGMKT